MLSALGLLALAGAGANAIVIPSTVTIEQFAEGLVDPHTQLLQLPCPGCMYAQPHGDGFIWTKGVENTLLLNISVGSNPSTLELNSVQFYPPPMTLDSEPPVPYIPQVPASVSLADIKADPARYTGKPLRLTKMFLHASSAQIVNDEGHELLTISLSLGALETQDINVPDLIINTLKDTEGKLTIFRVDQVSVSEGPKAGNKECKGLPLLCKLKAMAANCLKAFKASFTGRKPCSGMSKPRPGRPVHNGKIEGAKETGDEGEQHHGGKHGKHPGHGHRHGHGHGHHGWHRHHRHHRLHRILRAVARVLLTVFVPILIGVAAGMFLYLVGFVIGTALGFIFDKLVGRRPGYQAIALTEENEPLPRGSMEKFEYKDEETQFGESPPEYVEVEGKEVQVEKK